MTSSLQQLIEIAGLVQPAAPYEWESVEAEIGATVPEDYRRLVNDCGGGLWLAYVALHVPGDLDLDLARSGAEFEQLVESWKQGAVARPADLPREARLLPWASTGAGVTFYWEVTPGAAPDTYPIRASDREGADWVRYDMLTTDLLLGMVRGEIADEVLNPAWFDFGAIFSPIDDEE